MRAVDLTTVKKKPLPRWFRPGGAKAKAAAQPRVSRDVDDALPPSPTKEGPDERTGEPVGERTPRRRVTRQLRSTRDDVGGHDDGGMSRAIEPASRRKACRLG